MSSGTFLFIALDKPEGPMAVSEDGGKQVFGIKRDREGALSVRRRWMVLREVCKRIKGPKLTGIKQVSKCLSLQVVFAYPLHTCTQHLRE